MPWTELVILSHLRWQFVWQRPHHLVSRLARNAPTWFVEEPITAEVDAPVLRGNRHGAVFQLRLDVPGPERHHDFDDPAAASYAGELLALLGDDVPGRAVWVYTPLALDLARALRPSLLVYDVMDDLASFKDAAPELRERQRELLVEADVVFTGGRSLQRSVAAVRPDAHCFPSGVEYEHFLPARERRHPRARPVAGFVGVIDERLDLDLVGALARELPDWDVQVVGPVAKIDPSSLPSAPNLHFPGPQPYERLPDVMAGFDVAIMPFARNDATRSISPTKTLEYFAAGLPVVSTRVPDVVADYGQVVHLADDGTGFAVACRQALSADPRELHRATWPVLRRQHWDALATRMAALMAASTIDLRARPDRPHADEVEEMV